MRRADGRVGGTPRAMRDIGKASRRPPAVRLRDRRRFPKAFGQRRARLPMSRIAAPRAPCRKPWEAVSMGHYQRSLVLRFGANEIQAGGAESRYRFTLLVKRG